MIKHVPFNPTIRYLGLPSSLQNICERYEKEGWALVRIIPNHQYESVAIFEKDQES